MLKNRLFTVFVGVALGITTVLTVREAAATTVVISRAESVASVCESLSSRNSIHTGYVREKGLWVTYTEDGPTGVDGGLIQLLSDKRTCAK